MAILSRSLEGAPAARATPVRFVCGVGCVAAQIAALLALSKLGAALAGTLGLPLPGNMVGMLCLLALLWSGLVRLEWLERGASLLLKHLAFFFVPIAVGLMSFGDMWRSSGLALLAILAASAAAGILCAGYVTKLLAR